jgi:hypothetical protein
MEKLDRFDDRDAWTRSSPELTRLPPLWNHSKHCCVVFPRVPRVS